VASRGYAPVLLYEFSMTVTSLFAEDRLWDEFINTRDSIQQLNNNNKKANNQIKNDLLLLLSFQGCLSLPPTPTITHVDTL